MGDNGYPLDEWSTPVSDPNGFGFGPGSPDDEEALRRFLAQFGLVSDDGAPIDPDQLMQRLQSVMAAMNTQLAGYGAADATSGMNWGFTKDLVQRTIQHAGDDPAPTSAQQGKIRDAVALADLWLDDEIAFTRLSALPAGWSRQQWLDHSFATWQSLVQPVISALSVALRALMSNGQPPGAEPMLRLAVSSMFSAQVSQSLAKLATTVLTGSDLGLPVSDEARVCLLPTNIESFAEGLDNDADDILLYFAVRETARQRLFAAVPWLAPQLLALIEHYARDITIDTDALEQALEDQLNAVTNITDLEQAGNAVARSLFAPQRTAEQDEVLGRLETLLALVEGWVDEVTARVTASRMPAAAGLTEMLRRRRVSGGPAETAFKNLVGLELRPRRTRDAENLWAAVRASRENSGRDALWAHPDLVPDADALDDPLGFAERPDGSKAPDELDTELARLLDEENGPSGS